MKAPSVGLRTQILLIVLGGAIIPLGLVGLWLTSSALRSGEDLLRDHLNASADQVAAVIRGRWEYRRGDIGLVADNAATVRAVSTGGLQQGDSRFLDALASGLARTIPSIELRDARGRPVWSSSPALRASAKSSQQEAVVDPPTLGPTVRVETPIHDARGRVVGRAITDVALSAIVPPDSARPLVPGGRLAIRTPAATVALPLAPGLTFPLGGVVQVGDETWIAVHRTLAEPAMEIAVAAPLAPYVARFHESATVGVAALVAVAFFAVIVTVGLATRATHPLAELAAASDAVTLGRLDRRVAVRGPTEVRRVGAGFNLMIENLQTTLDTLSRRSALAAVGEFATTLSHDVRNALTSIRVDLDRAALREMPDLVTEDLVHRALNNVARLESTVTGALQVARHGHAPLVDIDLRTAVRAAVETVRGTFAALPATLEVDLPSTQVLVRGDAAALEQLCANLLFNAAQALAPTGRARVSLTADRDCTELAIADTGVGIGDREMERLGTPYYSSKPNGTGLGLPIARQIVAGHGGTLTIDSTAGQGTTIRVRLPQVNGSFTPPVQDVQRNGATSLPEYSRNA